MENPGEILVADYLRCIKGCDFVDLNVYTKNVQGEIDVIGMNNETRCVYICEVVTHLTTGMLYVKDAKPETGPRLIRKFRKNIEYGKSAFSGYELHFMLWSPVVKDSKGKPENNQFYHLQLVKEAIEDEYGVQIEFVINEGYLKVIDEMRAYVRSESKELKSPILRFMQIEEWTKRRVQLDSKSDSSSSYKTIVQG